MCILYCVWLCTWKPKQREICGAKLELWLAINQQEKARQRQTTYNEQHGQYLSANAIVLRTYFIFTVALCWQHILFGFSVCLLVSYYFFCFFFLLLLLLSLSLFLALSVCAVLPSVLVSRLIVCVCLGARPPPNQSNRNNCFEFARFTIRMNKWMILITIWWPAEGGPMYRHCSMLALYSLCVFVSNLYV